MGLPAIKTAEKFDLRMMPANTDTAPSEIAGDLASMYGLKRERHLTMGGGGAGDSVDFTKIRALAETPHLSLVVENEKSTDMMSEDLTLDQLDLQLDLIDAAGDMVDQMAEAIADIVQNASDYTEDQKAQFVIVIENTHTLDKVNDGRVALPTAEIERLATETLDVMQDLFKADILPTSLKTATLPIIEKTADIFQIPHLNDKIVEFKNATSEIAKLARDIDGLKVALTALLASDTLDDDARQEIEDTIEKLEALEEGETLDRDLIKQIEGLSEKLGDFKTPEMVAVQTAIDTVKEQNITARAEIANVTPAQIRAIDVYMDRLVDAQKALPDDAAPTLTDIIAEALISLQENPTSIKSLAAVETLSETIATPALLAPLLASAAKPSALQNILSTLAPQGRSIQKTQTQALSATQKIPIAQVRQASAIYRTLNTAKQAIQSLIPANTNQNKVAPQINTNGEQPASNPGNKPEVFNNQTHGDKPIVLQKLATQIERAQNAINKSIQGVDTTIQLGLVATSKTFEQITQRVEKLKEAPKQLQNLLQKNIEYIAKKFEAPATHPAGCPCCKTAFARAAQLPIIGGIAQKLGVVVFDFQKTREAKNLNDGFKQFQAENGNNKPSSLSGMTPEQTKIQKLVDYLKKGCGGVCPPGCTCATAFKNATGIEKLLNKVTSFFELKKKPEPIKPSAKGPSLISK